SQDLGTPVRTNHKYTLSAVLAMSNSTTVLSAFDIRLTVNGQTVASSQGGAPVTIQQMSSTQERLSLTYQTGNQLTVEGNLGVTLAASEAGGAGSAILFDDVSLKVISSSCYSNCDQSDVCPILNVADFTCFLQ